MSLQPLNEIQTFIVLSLSIVLPLSIFFGRDIVRRRRLGILADLETQLFGSVHPERRAAFGPVSLARAKYQVREEDQGAGKVLRGVVAYLLPTTIFVIFTAVGYYLLFSVTYEGLKQQSLMMSGFPRDGEFASYQAGTVLVIASAFIGAYVWSVNYLVLRVANFDLTPLDFLRASTHILLTTVIAGVFRHVVAASTSAELALALVLLIAFMMGLFPSLGINVLIDRLPPSVRIKRVPQAAREIGRELPVDLLDGIGSAIKFRLGNYEIEDVQNLATENPIHLYIATPYSLCEVLDWVAQAQLLLAIGPERFGVARQRAVRDIFNLLDLGETAEGRSMLRGVILDGEPDDAMVATLLHSIERSLPVQRLLEIRETLALSGARQAPPATGSPVKLAAAE